MISLRSWLIWAYNGSTLWRRYRGCPLFSFFTIIQAMKQLIRAAAVCVFFMACYDPGKTSARADAAEHHRARQWFMAVRKLDYTLFENCAYGGHTADSFREQYAGFFYGDIKLDVPGSADPKNFGVDYFRHKYIRRTVTFHGKKVERSGSAVISLIHGTLHMIRYREGPLKERGFLVARVQIHDARE